MPVMKTIKENPLAVMIGSSGTIISLIIAIFALDARYAHAENIEKDKKEIKQIIEDTAIDFRKQMLEDKLFELDVKQAQSSKQRLSPVDAALSARYKRQLDEIIQKRNR